MPSPRARPSIRSARTSRSRLSASPLIAMTYYNIFHHYGLERAAGQLSRQSASAGPSCPTSRSKSPTTWRDACDDERRRDDLPRRALDARGPRRTPRAQRPRASATPRRAWRSRVEPRATATARESSSAVRATSDVPTYVGIGITHARAGPRRRGASDGVIVGSALVAADPRRRRRPPTSRRSSRRFVKRHRLKYHDRCST